MSEVSLDKATVLTTIYTIVDETMEASPVIQQALVRPGPEPQLSDAEVVTIALYQELVGEPREDHFFRLYADGLRGFFPQLNERSRYNRRKRELGTVIQALRLSLAVVSRTLQGASIAVVDSAPVPLMGRKRDKAASDFLGFGDYGFCSSKSLKYFGCKLHTVVSLTGTILGYLLTPASPYDNQPLEELLDSMRHHLEYLLGDKAYNDQALQEELRRYRALILLAPTKRNQVPVRTPAAQRSLNRLRLIVETVNAQLQEQLHLSKHYAKSVWGFVTRIAAKLTAHSVGMMVNILLGRPPLHLAELAV